LVILSPIGIEYYEVLNEIKEPALLEDALGQHIQLRLVLLSISSPPMILHGMNRAQSRVRVPALASRPSEIASISL
jgi:hypothetical protein